MNRKPRPGDPFRPDLGLQREMFDLRDYHRTFPSKAKGGKGLGSTDQGRVLLLNETGSGLAKYSIVRIGSRIIDADESDDRLRAYENSPYHNIEEPDGSINDPIAITLGPIGNNAVGVGLGVGVTQCDIDFTEANTIYPFARSIGGETGKLLASQEGNVEILSPRSVTEVGVHRCLVRLIGGWSYSEEGITDILETGGCECFAECAELEQLPIVIENTPETLTTSEGGPVRAAYRYRIDVSLEGDPLWEFASGVHVLTLNGEFTDPSTGLYYWDSPKFQGPCPDVPASEPDTNYFWRLALVCDGNVFGTLDPQQVHLALLYDSSDNPETSDDCFSDPSWTELRFWNINWFDPGCGNLFELNPLYMLRSQVSWYGGPIQCKICVEPTIGTHVIEGSDEWCPDDPNATYELEAATFYRVDGFESQNTTPSECCCGPPWAINFPDVATASGPWDFIPTQFDDDELTCNPAGYDDGYQVATTSLTTVAHQLDCLATCYVGASICLGRICDRDLVTFKNYQLAVTVVGGASGASFDTLYLSDWMDYNQLQAALLGSFTVTKDSFIGTGPSCFDTDGDIPDTLTVRPF